MSIGCRDPYTNEYTNQLSLRNFKMSEDNGATWNSIPWGLSWQWLGERNFSFKVDIPTVCSPDYDINETIKIH